MSEASSAVDRHLPCGRTTGELLTHHADTEAGEPADRELEAHLRDCPHCAAALRGIAQQWGRVRQAARESSGHPEALVERTLGTLRAIRHRRAHAAVELSQEAGTLRVSAEAALTLTRRLCTEILLDFPGVGLRSCRADAALVEISVVVDYPLPAAELAEQVRRHLHRELHAQFGAGTPPVSVSLADVLPPWG